MKIRKNVKKQNNTIKSITRSYAILIYSILIITQPILLFSSYSNGLQGEASVFYHVLLILKFVLCSCSLIAAIKRNLVFESCSLYLLISTMISLIIEKLLGYILCCNHFKLDVLYQYVDAEIFITLFFTYRLKKLKASLHFYSQDIFFDNKDKERGESE